MLGSLYLAYDSLGGQHGPLRLLTRAVTYSVVFGVGYGLGLGLWFGWCRELRPALLFPSNSIGQHAGSIIIRCRGKERFRRFADLVRSDYIELWEFDLRSDLPSSSRSARCLRTPAEYALPSTYVAARLSSAHASSVEDRSGFQAKPSWRAFFRSSRTHLARSEHAIFA